MAYITRGAVWNAKEDYNNAVADYNEAIRLNPIDPVLFAIRGLSHQAKGNLDAAVADFKSALGLNPPDVGKYRELLRAAESLKQQNGQ